ncbi:protein of unknown function [Paraburkholderia kururiensis]
MFGKSIRSGRKVRKERSARGVWAVALRVTLVALSLKNALVRFPAVYNRTRAAGAAAGPAPTVFCQDRTSR